MTKNQTWVTNPVNCVRGFIQAKCRVCVLIPPLQGRGFLGTPLPLGTMVGANPHGYPQAALLTVLASTPLPQSIPAAPPVGPCQHLLPCKQMMAYKLC